MKKIKIFLTIAMLTLSMSVTSAQSNSAHVEKTKNVATKKYNVKNHELSGKATYYGLHYNKGRKTASGKIYDKNKFTAAHKTLPFGTKVRVTNKHNGKSVVVEITDRGPFGPGRIIDLSVIAAKELDMIRAGVVSCVVEVISWPTK